MKRKLHTGKRGGKFYIRNRRKVYIGKKRGAWGTVEQRLWTVDKPDHPFHNP